MKITNKTCYDSRTIRSAICTVHDRLAKTEGRLPQWKRVRVEVVYARTRTVHGCAVVGGTYMQLVLLGPQRHKIHRYEGDGPLVCEHCGEALQPTGSKRGHTIEDATTWETLYSHHCKIRAPSRITPAYLAGLIDHELRHLYGFRHDKMGTGYTTGAMWRREHEAASWATEAFGWNTLPLAGTKPKREIDLVAVRHAAVLDREKSWTSKLKRAQTALRKIRQQRKYYETKLAARGKP